MWEEKDEKPIDKILSDDQIRRLLAYKQWVRIAENVEGCKSVPETLCYLLQKNFHVGLHGNRAFSLMLQDKYPAFIVMERLKGKK